MRRYTHQSHTVMARAPTYDLIVAAIARMHGTSPERVQIHGERVVVEGIRKAHCRVVAYGREWRYESGAPRS